MKKVEKLSATQEFNAERCTPFYGEDIEFTEPRRTRTTKPKTQSLFELKKIQTDFPQVKITSSKDAYDVIRKYYGDDIEVFESMFILLLNRANTTVGYAKISQGGIVGTVVDIKLVAKYCIDNLASGCILAHNHPSGNLMPSSADHVITHKTMEALKLLDVTLQDHLILSVDNYYSMNDEGTLNNQR